MTETKLHAEFLHPRKRNVVSKFNIVAYLTPFFLQYPYAWLKTLSIRQSHYATGLLAGNGGGGPGGGVMKLSTVV